MSFRNRDRQIIYQQSMQSMPINRLILIIDENQCQSMTIDNHTSLDDRLLIDYQYQSINWHRLPSIVIDYWFHWLVTPWFVYTHESFASIDNFILSPSVRWPTTMLSYQTSSLLSTAFLGLWNKYSFFGLRRETFFSNHSTGQKGPPVSNIVCDSWA